MRISDGELIGELGAPKTKNFYSNPVKDDFTVTNTSVGIQVHFSVLGVGFFMEVVENGKSVGFRSMINSFDTCTDSGEVFSNGK